MELGNTVAQEDTRASKAKDRLHLRVTRVQRVSRMPERG
jgi:hypothetical protein